MGIEVTEAIWLSVGHGANIFLMSSTFYLLVDPLSCGFKCFLSLNSCDLQSFGLSSNQDLFLIPVDINFSK